MIIHTVQPNETIDSIAQMYGVSADKLLTDNHINDPDLLVIGESLIVMIPKEAYVIQEGDSLASIAESYGVSAMQLLRNNPQLCVQQYIYPGEEIIIYYEAEKSMEISVNGYAFPFINTDVLRKTLPYLTYLTIFYYRVKGDGTINDIDDLELIDMAWAYGVGPIMCISAISEGGNSDVEAIHSILTSKEKQDNLIAISIDNMKAKNYYGLNIDFQNILPEDRQLYVEFIDNISTQVKLEGYYVNITLTPRTFPSGTDMMYRGPEYSTLGQLTDSTMLLSYEWGHASSPQPALPITEVRALLNYSISQIPPEKINIGIPTIGYIWQLPFIPEESVANAITHDSALTLAYESEVTVLRDVASEAPYFSFANDTEYIVWFRDVRSSAALLGLVKEFQLEGIGVWNTMQFASGFWLLLNAQFNIKKVE